MLAVLFNGRVADVLIVVLEVVVDAVVFYSLPGMKRKTTLARARSRGRFLEEQKAIRTHYSLVGG